jgi:hypothetical protein
MNTLTAIDTLMVGGDMRINFNRRFEFFRWAILLGAIACSTLGLAQQPADQPKTLSASSSEQDSREQDLREQGLSEQEMSSSIRELREQVRELQSAVAELRSEWQQTHAENEGLRHELHQVRSAGVSGGSALQNSPQAYPSGTPINQQPDQQEAQNKANHSASLEEEYQLLSGKVDDQYQTKVESASKYRVRLSGIVLMNLASDQGAVDSIDLPMVAYPRPAGDSGGSFSATLRQSQIGLEAFGPMVAGAKTTADLQLDLAGGFPQVPNGINSGLMRLRTATMRMDWANTSLVVGQDAIFFSPNSPTSFASLAIPALSSAGNVWAWVPQIRVEHKVAVTENSNLIFQAGILDPVSGETPSSTYYRAAGPGESSRQPAYGTRVAWTTNIFGQPLRIGAGGFYNRQDYGFERNVDGWAGMADFDLPLNHQFSLSGKFYRGRAIGGLYAGIGRSVLFSGNPTLPTTEVQPLDSAGGWAQLKYRPANKWEFNAAFGMDDSYASDLKYFPYAQSYGDPSLAKNQGSFANMIYRPRSDLLFSAEYRRLKTYSLIDGASNAGQLNLMMGVLF